MTAQKSAVPKVARLARHLAGLLVAYWAAKKVVQTVVKRVAQKAARSVSHWAGQSA